MTTPASPTPPATNLQHLCPTARAIARVLDGASERAVLVADDGAVLHKNGAACRFLFSSDKNTVRDFLALPPDSTDNNKDNWKSVEHCRIVMMSGKTTRTERYLHWVWAEEACSCGSCPPQQYYHTVYICSKHERVREVVDHAFDPVVTANEKGIICTVNEALTDLFQYSESELVGKNLHILCGGGHAKRHDQYLKAYLETGKTTVIGTRREVFGRRKDGTEFPCELGVQVIADVSTGQRFFCGFFKDLTLLKKHEAELLERQALAQGMINASFDTMVEIDQSGIIKVVNDAACTMLGYTREEFLGSNISMICGDGHGARHDSYLQRYLQSGQRHIIGVKRQVKARRKDGSEIEVELGVQEVTLATGEKAFCGFIRDMTAQKKDKRALRKQQQLIHGKFFGDGGDAET